MDPDISYCQGITLGMQISVSYRNSGILVGLLSIEKMNLRDSE